MEDRMKHELFNSGGLCRTDNRFANGDLIWMNIGADMINFLHATQRCLRRPLKMR